MNAQEANRPKGPRAARRAALLVWLAWLASAGMLWWGTWACVMHPRCFGLVSLLLVQLAGAAAAAGLGLWRTVRGPSRLAAFDWTLVAVVPILLWVALASYVFGCVRQHTLPMNPATRTALVAGAALADAEARVRFPQRLEGERVVMIYDQVADPAGDLAAMERHVAELERVLGRPSRGKVHWVRGTLLGMGPLGFQGLATGDADDGPTEVDRHEVAHGFISQFVPADAEPPTVLTEGWAQSHQGDSTERMARRAWWAHSEEELPTLRELVGPEWYFRMWPAAYVYGAALVDYLLREHGAEKFLELYTTCRQETSGADCQRILGVGLDELEQRFWADVAEIATRPALPADQSISSLLGLPEPEPIDEAAREDFLSQYLPAAEKLETAYREVQIEAVKDTSRRFIDGEEEVRERETAQMEVARNGDRARLVLDSEDGVEVSVSAPQAVFFLRKPPGEEAFELQRFESQSPDLHRTIIKSIELRGSLKAAYGFGWWSISDWISKPEFRITEVSRCERDGRPLVTVGHEFTEVAPEGELVLQAGWFTVAPDDGWAVQDYELHIKTDEDLSLSEGGVVLQGHVEYGPAQGGLPTLRRVEARRVVANKGEWQTSIDVTRCEFGPVPESEFRLASFGLDPPAEDHEPEVRVVRADPFARVLHGTLWSLAAIVGILGVSVSLQWFRRPAQETGGGASPPRERVSEEAPSG